MTGREQEGDASGVRQPAKPPGKPGDVTTNDIAPRPGPKPPGTAIEEPADGDTTFAVPATAPATPEPS